ncbi:hypothetical protein N9Z24_03755 [Gammaproteobacteria bacterium]|nr:hypothetical protein [Gammaproteobacteria bacterium]
MSLLNKASLIQIPSGYKDGTLYSAKPTNGDGDFTFSRGSNLAATRVNSEGLIEKGRENLLLQSNSFDTTWSNNNTTETSGQADKDGGTDAWLVNSTASFGSIVQSISNTNGVYSLSVYAKAGTNNWMLLRMLGSSSSRAWFDLENGVLGSTDGPTIESKIESVGGGWYRCSVTGNMTSFSQVLIYPTNANLVVGTSGSIIIQDAQLENGLVATDYIETTTTTAQAGILEDMPRLDYSGGASCPALLLEPQRTNKIPHSEYLNAVTKSNVTINTNSDISPEGVQNAHNVIANATNSDHLFFQSSMGGSTNANTQTIYAKANGYDWIYIRFDIPTKRAFFNVANGTLGTADSGITHTIKNVGNGWYRCSATMTTTNYANAVLGLASADNTDNFLGDGTSGVLMYGWQSEEASYPTSYIPTYGSSVTRGSDIATNDNVNLIGLDEFTFLWDGVLDSPRNGSGTFAHLTLDGTIGFKGASNTDIRVDVVGSGNFAKGTSVQTLTEGRHKLLLKMSASGTGKVFIDGSEISGGITYSGTTFTTDDGKLDGGSYKQNVNKVLVFPTDLTDAECIALTTI